MQHIYSTMKYTIRITICAVVALLMLALPCQSSAKDRLAVMDLEANTGVNQGLAEALSEEIRTVIHNLCGFEVLSKQDIEAISKRLRTQYTFGCEKDLQCLIDFGNQLETRYMVAGSISRIDKTYSISLRLIDTKGSDAGVKKRSIEKCYSQNQLFDTAKTAATSLIKCKNDKRYKYSVGAVLDYVPLSLVKVDSTFLLYGGQLRRYTKKNGYIEFEFFSGTSKDEFFYGYGQNIYEVTGGNAKLLRTGFSIPVFASDIGITLYSGAGFESIIISYELKNNVARKVDKKSFYMNAGLNYSYGKFFTELKGRYVFGENDDLGYNLGSTFAIGIKF